MFRVNDEFVDGVSPAVTRAAEAAEQGLSRRSARIKRVFDATSAAMLLILFAPLYAIVALGVRLSSAGPILYYQDRIGQHGCTFRFYKFRSMVVNSEEVLTDFLNSNHDARSEWDAYQKLESDPRVTAIGRFIRRTSLDELPQLWNVLCGDMSLIGPRPCMPAQKALYGRHWAVYCSVKPGVTGLWQVSGRNYLTYEQRVQLDVAYVKNWSLWSDMVILFRTVRVVLTGHGSR